MVKSAREIGFCFGVKRAVSLCEDALKKYGTCVSLGPIIHNERVNERLASAGLEVVDPAEAGAKPVIIRSHGLHPDIRRKLTSGKRKVIDATCPFVRRVQELVEELRKKGYIIVIVGKKDHPEVTALAGFAGRQGYVYPVKPETVRGKKVAVVSQTTSTEEDYQRALIAILKSGLPAELRTFDTVCRVTERRQKEARRIAGQSDILLVIGSRKSANTRNLYRLLRREEKQTFLVSAPDEIKKSWCGPNLRIGLVSGTSTPEETIQEIKQKLEKGCDLNV